MHPGVERLSGKRSKDSKRKGGGPKNWTPVAGPRRSRAATFLPGALPAGGRGSLGERGEGRHLWASETVGAERRSLVDESWDALEEGRPRRKRAGIPAAGKVVLVAGSP